VGTKLNLRHHRRGSAARAAGIRGLGSISVSPNQARRAVARLLGEGQLLPEGNAASLKRDKFEAVQKALSFETDPRGSALVS
jgi:hypothetical protein